MNQPPSTFSDDEFEELDAWLERRRAGITDIVELEGFLTAIVIGPNTLSPNLWLHPHRIAQRRQLRGDSVH